MALAAHQVAITAESFSYIPGMGLPLLLPLTGQHLEPETEMVLFKVAS